mmetsp:Transcript_20890/g.40961  ORF Transcript_20890/g.40961 Transcript_20890/m.40961 type:complete len:342 (+) Transcript_20890:438-1463(+)|eukprot:CAMPEP_0171498828 /NCGR_PEP_ID=MMETSP0958-20121227/8075_1 /TAXON_ID=87120 /ORGANISM="Aurantiochytrium limacinum, Strain ATCCMYA-1381" /LENGTH=341 /DNA_ID=CAMNT_0012033287 /DNA_START=169 /DNA_END=1194 /DNA_ORIENTATION=+
MTKADNLLVEEELLQFIRNLPKAELHAHLHGSVREETLRELGCEGFVAKGRTLQECFDLFGTIHNAVQNTRAVQIIARGVVADFAQDNVRYLELRSTPRSTPEMSKEDYLLALVEAVTMAGEEHNVMVKLIVSIDRAKPVADAYDTLKVVAALPSAARQIIVGVDLSGNPTRGVFANFVPVLNIARNKLRLKVTLHCGEVVNPQEVQEMLQFAPERLGHALHIAPELRTQLPVVECCPTSNIKTLGLNTLGEHPVLPPVQWSNLTICTDDAGVFETTLSEEILMVAKEFQLSKSDIARLVYSPLKHAFASFHDITELRARYWHSSYAEYSEPEILLYVSKL